MAGCSLRDRVDDAAADPRPRAPMATTMRRFLACPDDDMARATGAMEEVPGLQSPLLLLDDQQTLAGQHEDPS